MSEMMAAGLIFMIGAAQGLAFSHIVESPRRFIWAFIFGCAWMLAFSAALDLQRETTEGWRATGVWTLGLLCAAAIGYGAARIVTRWVRLAAERYLHAGSPTATSAVYALLTL